MLEFAGVPSETNTCEKIMKQWNWRVGLRCKRPSSFSVFLPCYLKGKYKRWPLHYLHEHAWRRGPATAKDSPSHRTCTGDPPKQEKITSERARIIQHIVRNNHALDMSLCHGGVLVEHECVCESRRIRVRRVGACRTIVESGREREFVPPQPLVVWG
jgi:hypothetical protein